MKKIQSMLFKNVQGIDTSRVLVGYSFRGIKRNAPGVFNLRQEKNH
jgi:hypothetical protein